MNVLVIAPHPDDESIACGGTICLHAARGDRVAVAFLTSGEGGGERLRCLPPEQAWRIREREAEAAAEILGVNELTFLRHPDWFLGEEVGTAADSLGPILKREAPQIIYLPHAGEWHPDHQAALPIVLLALRGNAIPEPSLLTYEFWTPLSQYDHNEDITSVMANKVRAIRCHRSQLELFRYDLAARGLSQYRSVLHHCRYAEVFKSYTEYP
jgi:LmbE family N-acetylglucosaminyl deacetylase